MSDLKITGIELLFAAVAAGACSGVLYSCLREMVTNEIAGEIAAEKQSRYDEAQRHLERRGVGLSSNTSKELNI